MGPLSEPLRLLVDRIATPIGDLAIVADEADRQIVQTQIDRNLFEATTCDESSDGIDERHEAVEGHAGRRPTQVLENVLEIAGELTLRHAACYIDTIQPDLAAQGIEILRWKELSAAEQGGLHQLFRERIYPVLTPLVVDPAHPFPYISGLSLSLAVMVADRMLG